MVTRYFAILNDVPANDKDECIWHEDGYMLVWTATPKNTRGGWLSECTFESEENAQERCEDFGYPYVGVIPINLPDDWKELK